MDRRCAGSRSRERACVWPRPLGDGPRCLDPVCVGDLGRRTPFKNARGRSIRKGDCGNLKEMRGPRQCDGWSYPVAACLVASFIASFVISCGGSAELGGPAGGGGSSTG